MRMLFKVLHFGKAGDPGCRNVGIQKVEAAQLAEVANLYQCRVGNLGTANVEFLEVAQRPARVPSPRRRCLVG